MVPDIPDSWQQVQAWAIWLTAVGGCAFGLWRYLLRPRVVRPLRNGWSRISAALTDVGTLKTSVADLQRNVQTVKSEITTNGGKSVKDSINRIERSAEMTHGKLVAIIDTATQPIMQFDEGGHCVAVNRSFELLTGYALADLRHWGWVNVIHPADRDNVIDDWAEAVKHQRFFAREFRCQTRERQIVPVRALAKPMLSTSGQILGWHGVFERLEVTA